MTKKSDNTVHGNPLEIKEEKPTPVCTCVQDPYASLPPETRPKNKSWKSSFRQVTCPGCRLEYWTNCEGDFCTACQKKGIQIPKSDQQK